MMKKQPLGQSNSPAVSERIDPEDAVFARIYERYGSDLAAFFRDAQRAVSLKAAEKCGDESEPASN